MSKKVLILSGSPRKCGNSDLLCDEFAKGAVEKGAVVAGGVYEKGEIKIHPAKNLLIKWVKMCNEISILLKNEVKLY